MGKLHDLVGRNNAVDIRLGANGRYRVEHVVRGNTNAEILEAMEHEPDQLLERLRVAREAASARPPTCRPDWSQCHVGR